jgi:hypothetical protein
MSAGVVPSLASNDIQDWATGGADTSGLLRAERFTSDRSYTLTYEGRDLAGNTATCMTTVTVPKNQKSEVRPG